MQDFKQALQEALKQSKERQMQNANTQTQLNEIVKNWDAEEKFTRFGKPTQPVASAEPEGNRGHNLISNNVSRATFCYVRDNPHKTKTEITNALAAKGYNASSVSTLVGQMVRGGQAVSDDEGRIFTMFKEYTPIKNGSAIIRMQKKKKKKTTAVTHKANSPAGKDGIAALNVQAAPALPKPTPAQTVTGFDADKLLSTLSFADVITLHRKIKTMLSAMGA